MPLPPSMRGMRPTTWLGAKIDSKTRIKAWDFAMMQCTVHANLGRLGLGLRLRTEDGGRRTAGGPTWNLFAACCCEHALDSWNTYVRYLCKYGINSYVNDGIPTCCRRAKTASQQQWQCGKTERAQAQAASMTKERALSPLPLIATPPPRPDFIFTATARPAYLGATSLLFIPKQFHCPRSRFFPVIY